MVGVEVAHHFVAAGLDDLHAVLVVALSQLELRVDVDGVEINGLASRLLPALPLQLAHYRLLAV